MIATHTGLPGLQSQLGKPGTVDLTNPLSFYRSSFISFLADLGSKTNTKEQQTSKSSLEKMVNYHKLYPLVI